MSNTSRAIPSLLAICVVVIVLAVLGLASDVITRLLTNVDGLLLAIVCLLMAGLFALMMLVLANEMGLLPSRSKPSGEAAAGK